MTIVGHVRCLVYRRQYGFAYTVQVDMEGDRILQISTTQNEYTDNEEVCMMKALASAEDLEPMLVWPEPMAAE